MWSCEHEEARTRAAAVARRSHCRQVMVFALHRWDASRLVADRRRRGAAIEWRTGDVARPAEAMVALEGCDAVAIWPAPGACMPADPIDGTKLN